MFFAPLRTVPPAFLACPRAFVHPADEGAYFWVFQARSPNANIAMRRKNTIVLVLYRPQTFVVVKTMSSPLCSGAPPKVKRSQIRDTTDCRRRRAQYRNFEWLFGASGTAAKPILSHPSPRHISPAHTPYSPPDLRPCSSVTNE